MGKRLKPPMEKTAVVVSALCAVICVFATFHSCRVATQANVIANLQSRPYLSLDVISENGQFLRAEKNNGGIRLLMTYRIKNFGSTPACNIEFAENVETGQTQDGKSNFAPLNKPGPVSIAAGEEYVATFIAQHEDEGEYVDFLQKVRAGVITVNFDLLVKYTGMPPEDSQYFTGLSCHVSSQGKNILKSSIR